MHPDNSSSNMSVNTNMVRMTSILALRGHAWALKLSKQGVLDLSVPPS